MMMSRASRFLTGRRFASSKVLFVGLMPEHVDYAKWAKLRPEMELTPEKLKAGLDLSLRQIDELGYEGKGLWIDTGATAEDVVRAELATTTYDAVVVGAGVRTDPDHALLFEKLVNIVHAGAPGAKICFNTSPDTTIDAVKRWL